LAKKAGDLTGTSKDCSNKWSRDVNREKNCYSCGGFGYLARNYRNQEIIEWGRKLEYGNERDNLKEKKSSTSPQLGSNNYNRFAMLSRVIKNTFCYNTNNRNILREVTVKIGLERMDI